MLSCVEQSPESSPAGYDCKAQSLKPVNSTQEPLSSLHQHPQPTAGFSANPLVCLRLTATSPLPLQVSKFHPQSPPPANEQHRDVHQHPKDETQAESQPKSQDRPNSDTPP